VEVAITTLEQHWGKTVHVVAVDLVVVDMLEELEVWVETEERVILAERTAVAAEVAWGLRVEWAVRLVVAMLAQVELDRPTLSVGCLTL